MSWLESTLGLVGQAISLVAQELETGLVSLNDTVQEMQAARQSQANRGLEAESGSAGRQSGGTANHLTHLGSGPTSCLFVTLQPTAVPKPSPNPPVSSNNATSISPLRSASPYARPQPYGRGDRKPGKVVCHKVCHDSNAYPKTGHSRNNSETLSDVSSQGWYDGHQNVLSSPESWQWDVGHKSSEDCQERLEPWAACVTEPIIDQAALGATPPAVEEDAVVAAWPPWWLGAATFALAQVTQAVWVALDSRGCPRSRHRQLLSRPRRAPTLPPISSPRPNSPPALDLHSPSPLHLNLDLDNNLSEQSLPSPSNSSESFEVVEIRSDLSCFETLCSMEEQGNSFSFAQTAAESPSVFTVVDSCLQSSSANHINFDFRDLVSSHCHLQTNFFPEAEDKSELEDEEDDGTSSFDVLSDPGLDEEFTLLESVTISQNKIS